MSGQELALELERRKGCKPSPGTIYPALKSLKESNFIKESEEGKTIRYTLTQTGKQALGEAKQQFCKTFKDVF